MDIKNICILAGIILLIRLDLKIIFTCIAKSYIRRNKEKLFGANEPLTQVSKDLGYDLCNKLPQYQDCIKKLGIDQRYECSSSIVSNASNNAVKYLIKYSNITNSKECLEDIDFCINYMELLNELCANMKKLQANMEMQLPVIIRLFTKKEKLPYTICSVNYEIAKIKRPEFCFSYVSPAGRSGRSYTIKATPELLKNVWAEIGYKLSKTEHSKTQRNAMTNDLREAIKKRDNYTCCLCGNSIFKEPNLLLEVDHIIPVSKGGRTEAGNLQTLCWRCNRAKHDH